MTDFRALSYAMGLCTERESALRRRASGALRDMADLTALLDGAEEASAARSHLQHMRAIRTCHWTEDSDGQLHAHDRVWNPGDYVFCPTCGLPTSISKNHDL